MNSMRQLPLDLHRRPAPTLENFVTGDNAEVVALAHRLARGDRQTRFVYLWGPPGAGRSHLLQALAPQGRLVLPGTPVPATVADGDLVLVDDCQALDADGQQALFGLYNQVQAGVAATLVVAGDAPPVAMRLREDLRTRLGWGLVLQLRLLDDYHKAAALERHARSRGVALGRDLVPYLLARYDRDIRSLIALFDALDRYAFERKRPLSRQLLREFEAEADAAAGDPGPG
jgi:DnaA family protein